jgi:hypothetical protein
MTEREAVDRALLQIPGYVELPEERREELAAQVERDLLASRRSLLRPWLLLLAAIALGFLTYLLAAFIPGFRDMFAQMGMEELPLLTQGVLSASKVTRWFWPIPVLGCIALSVAAARELRIQKPMWGRLEMIALLGVLFLFGLSHASVMAVVLPIMRLQQKLGGN